MSKIIDEVIAERQRQIDKGHTPSRDDHKKGSEDWCNDIEAYIVWAKQMYRMGSPEKYRHRMKQVAALAVAACESYDRTHL